MINARQRLEDRIAEKQRLIDMIVNGPVALPGVMDTISKEISDLIAAAAFIEAIACCEPSGLSHLDAGHIDGKEVATKEVSFRGVKFKIAISQSEAKTKS